jgi:hypothetical protein
MRRISALLGLTVVLLVAHAVPATASTHQVGSGGNACIWTATENGGGGWAQAYEGTVDDCSWVQARVLFVYLCMTGYCTDTASEAARSSFSYVSCSIFATGQTRARSAAVGTSGWLTTT